MRMTILMLYPFYIDPTTPISITHSCSLFSLVERSRADQFLSKLVPLSIHFTLRKIEILPGSNVVNTEDVRE